MIDNKPGIVIERSRAISPCGACGVRGMVWEIRAEAGEKTIALCDPCMEGLYKAIWWMARQPKHEAMEVMLESVIGFLWWWDRAGWWERLWHWRMSVEAWGKLRELVREAESAEQDAAPGNG